MDTAIRRIMKTMDMASLVFISLFSFLPFTSSLPAPFTLTVPLSGKVLLSVPLPSDTGPSPLFSCPVTAIRLAPYPAFSTASIIIFSSQTFSSKLTCILLVSRFTVTSPIPGSFLTLLSTWEEQAEQVIPVTAYFCFVISFNSFYSISISSPVQRLPQ